jgi:hypothetical protein
MKSGSPTFDYADVLERLEGDSARAIDLVSRACIHLRTKEQDLREHVDDPAALKRDLHDLGNTCKQGGFRELAEWLNPYEGDPSRFTPEVQEALGERINDAIARASAVLGIRLHP